MDWLCVPKTKRSLKYFSSFHIRTCRSEILLWRYPWDLQRFSLVKRMFRSFFTLVIKSGWISLLTLVLSFMNFEILNLWVCSQLRKLSSLFYFAKQSFLSFLLGQSRYNNLGFCLRLLICMIDSFNLRGVLWLSWWKLFWLLLKLNMRLELLTSLFLFLNQLL